MSEGAGHSGGSAGSNLVPIVVLVLWVVAAAAVAVPNLLTTTGGHGNATPTIASLRNLVSCQQDFRERKLVDLDGDGVGEFGTIGEMAGSAGVRTNADASTRRAILKPPILSPSLAGVTGAGVVTKSGYAFRVFLPGKGGGAVREERSNTVFRRGVCVDCVDRPPDAPCGRCGELASPLAGAVHTDFAEVRWCAYSWPVAAGSSGLQSFFVDQEGEVWETANKDLRYTGYAREVPDRSPAWDAAMPASGTGWTPTDPKVKEYRGRDGNVWKRLP